MCAILRALVLGVALLCGVSSVSAGCHFMLGYGQSNVADLRTEKYEDRLLDHKYATGDYVEQKHSNPIHIGGGCDFNRYFGWEVEHIENMRSVVSSTFQVSSGKHSVGVQFERGMELYGWALEFTGKLPVTEKLSLTGRLGAFFGKAKMEVSTSALPEGLVWHKEKSGATPVVGVGLSYQVLKQLSLASEWRYYDRQAKFSEVLMVARIHF